MDNRLRRFPNAGTLVLGAATLALFWVPGPARAQSTANQARPAMPDQQAAPGDDITRRDLARFDQFLDSHHEIATQLRRTPSLIDDPQFLQNHPELSAYLQDHPSVKQEISERPDTFMRLEDLYGRDTNLRDRDAGGQAFDADRRDAGSQDRDADRRDAGSQDRDANRGDAANQDRDADRRDAMNQDRDADRRGDADRGDAAMFDRFLGDHREIAELVRKDPSLLDNRKFVDSHPALQAYLRDNTGVRDQIKQDPSAFMRQADQDDRDSNLRGRVTGGPDRDPDVRYAANQDRDADRRGADRSDGDNQNRDTDRRVDDRRDVATFDRFLDEHREIGEQVRRDPSLLDNRDFIQSHPALQTYLQDNPGVREQVRQNPSAFMQQAELNNRDADMHGRDLAHGHMADFGGFLGSHSDIQRDLARDPSMVKDHQYMQNHAELNAYLNAHPDVRAELMANPQDFVHGAQQYNGSTGTPSTGSSMNPAATTHVAKPNQ